MTGGERRHQLFGLRDGFKRGFRCGFHGRLGHVRDQKVSASTRTKSLSVTHHSFCQTTWRLQRSVSGRSRSEERPFRRQQSREILRFVFFCFKGSIYYSIMTTHDLEPRSLPGRLRNNSMKTANFEKNTMLSTSYLRFLDRSAGRSGGLAAGSHIIQLCIIAPGFNIDSFTMTAHVAKVGAPAHVL